MRSLLFLILLAITSFKMAATEVQIIKVVNLKNAQGSTLSYFHELLVDALTATEDLGKFEIQQVNFDAAQNRSMRLLNQPGMLDVMHTMEQTEWNESLIKVPQPLLNGLLGTRAFLVKKSNLQKFNSITKQQLKQQIACQGIHWKDSDILEANGYNVYRVPAFDSMLKMLASGRCDYFPRGINEIDIDFADANAKYGDLAIVTQVFFQYPAPVYFYTGQHNQALAQRLQEGFNRLGNRDYIKTKVAKSSFANSLRYMNNKQARFIQLNK